MKKARSVVKSNKKMEKTKEKKYKTEQKSCLYLSSGGENLVEFQVDQLPPVEPEHTRVVCIR